MSSQIADRREGKLIALRRTNAVRKPLRQRRWFAIGLAAVALVVAFAVCTAVLFVWPSQGAPSRVNAIVMLDGPGDRLATAYSLARAHTAPVLLISLGTPYSNVGNTCPQGVRGVRVVCFNPKPATTRGEAEYVGRLARRYHWRSIVLVTMTPQITPGSIWVSRCAGPGTAVYSVGAALPASAWPGALMHEWGALINAELIQRSC